MSKEFSSALKARNIADTLKEHGFEKGIFVCVQQLAEYQQVLRESQVELATQINKLSDLFMSFVAVADEMKNAVEAIESKDKDVGDVQKH